MSPRPIMLLGGVRSSKQLGVLNHSGKMARLQRRCCGRHALGGGVQVALQRLRRGGHGAAGRHVHPVLQLHLVHVLQGALIEVHDDMVVVYWMALVVASCVHW